MPKPKKAEVEPKSEVVPEEKVAPEWPKVRESVRFHAVPFDGGYVIYNPAGQRITGKVTEEEAKRAVLGHNQAAHIKG